MGCDIHGVVERKWNAPARHVLVYTGVLGSVSLLLFALPGRYA